MKKHEAQACTSKARFIPLVHYRPHTNYTKQRSLIQEALMIIPTYFQNWE